MEYHQQGELDPESAEANQPAISAAPPQLAPERQTTRSGLREPDGAEPSDRFSWFRRLTLQDQQRLYCVNLLLPFLLLFIFLLAVPAATGVGYAASRSGPDAHGASRRGRWFASIFGIASPALFMLLHCFGLFCRLRWLLAGATVASLLSAVYVAVASAAGLTAVTTSAAEAGLGGDEGGIALAASGGSVIGALLLTLTPCGLMLYVGASQASLVRTLWDHFATDPPSASTGIRLEGPLREGIPVVAREAPSGQANPPGPVPIAPPVRM